jgi:glycosyltransferase involved in cell wall biosynthesis
VLAVVPAHNETSSIAAVVAGTKVHLPVLVVDDGSSDDTAARAAAAGADVLRRKVNEGKGVALRAGFREALARGCEAVVTLDADGQHAPDDIPALLDAYTRSAADLVIGYRDFREMPPVRRAANVVGGWALGWAVGRKVRDNQSGYRLVGRRLMEAMLPSQESGFAFEVEMVAVCVARGWPLEWVPIQTIYAGERSHIDPLPHAMQFLRTAWRIRRSFMRS